MLEAAAELEPVTRNPFHVLELTPSATRAEIERAAQRLLGSLELCVTSAGAYRTPLGSLPRSPELVRWAASELRDPERRLAHELWFVSSESWPEPDELADSSFGELVQRAATVLCFG
jgi:hypothetical protein